jgi:signal transduction histidine kinase
MRGSQRLDVVLGGTLLVTGLLEVAADRVGFRPIPAVIAVLVGSAAMLLRSTRPVLCLAVFVTVAVVTQIPGIAEALTASVAVGCLLALGNVGRRSSDPISITAVIATIAIFTLGTVFGSRPLDAVVVVLGCGTAWGAGRLMRRDAGRNIELIELAAQLTSEREARAREAVGAERARIARELHDAVAHTVSVMTIQTGGVRRRLDTDPERVRERDVLLNVAEITISVLDTGQGREDYTNGPGSGFGLEVMRERAALYGGTVEAGRDSSGGYAVRVMLPVPQGVDGDNSGAPRR